MNVDAVLRFLECVGQEQGEEDAEESWGREIALLHSIFGREGLRVGSSKPDSPKHVLVEGHDHTRKVSGHPIR